jgi:short subunit fatty acids transporter
VGILLCLILEQSKTVNGLYVIRIGLMFVGKITAMAKMEYQHRTLGIPVSHHVVSVCKRETNVLLVIMNAQVVKNRDR